MGVYVPPLVFHVPPHENNRSPIEPRARRANTHCSARVGAREGSCSGAKKSTARATGLELVDQKLALWPLRSVPGAELPKAAVTFGPDQILAV